MSTLAPADVIRHVIDGEAVDSVSGRRFTSIDPATGTPIADVAFGEAADVDRAVASAKRAFRTGVWSKVPPATRAATLRRLASLIVDHQHELGQLESSDTGKPLAQATTEIRDGAEYFTSFAGLAELPNGTTHPVEDGYFAYGIREPYGVVAAICPWNYPFILACWKAAPALAVGNSVVLKMAEQTPLSTAVLARLALEAGIPAGVFNVVHGDGPMTGAALVAHPDVTKITFTGSTAVGQAILRTAADRLTSVHLELGGKTPNIVFEDADIEAAVAGSLFTAFYNSGQICTSGSRLLVHESIAGAFVEAFTERARGIVVGDPREPATQLGPLVSREQLERVTGYVREGLRDGARLILDGSMSDRAGYYIGPTVFADVAPDMRIAQEEIFGPVLSVMTFSEEADALAIANGVMYGLAATVWTTDLGRAFRMAEGLEAGIVWTNCPHYFPWNLPYAGHKMSGQGEDSGVESLRNFTRSKTHVVKFGGRPSDWA